MSFEKLHARLPWKPIRGCTGRWSLAPRVFSGPPGELLGAAGVQTEFLTRTRAADEVAVTRFAGGGLISYRKPGGSYLHTLNTPEGLERKLADLKLVDNVK